MFNYYDNERRPFVSNPALPEIPRVVPSEDNGIIRNKVVYEPQSNHSELEGVHYSAETMSLRAKLNLGVDLKQVHIGQFENDPTYLNNFAVDFERKISDKLAELNNPVENVESESNLE